MIVLGKDASGRITVSFPYDSQLVAKVKNIDDRRWHKDKKYWSFPNTDGTLEKILPRTTALPNTKLIPGLHLWLSVVRGLKAFEGEEIHIASVLRDNLSSHVVASPCLIGTKQSQFEDLRRELISRKYSYSTVKTYLYYNKELLRFIGKDPFNITNNNIKDYLLYLVEEKQSATSTLNQAINALKFYYGTMLKRKLFYEIKRPRKDKQLPIILSKEEVESLLLSANNIKHKAILMVIYSGGLRLSEVIKLEPEHIDSKRMLIFIKGAKGRKDRYTILSETALETLKEYYKQYKPQKWLFEGAKAGRYLSKRTVEKIFDQACEKANIKKDVSVHDLRHSFATHLLLTAVSTNCKSYLPIFVQKGNT